MKHDFDLIPPAAASVEVFDYGRDVNGNSTANFLICYSNGKTGAEWAGGSIRSRRRVQVGYGDKFSAGALDALHDRFPGTRWKIDPDSVKGCRGGGSVDFEALRDYDAEPVPVLFRVEGEGTPVAFFPTLPGTNDPWTVTTYAALGQHSSAAKSYYRDTRPATVDEAAPLKRELESLGYVLTVATRWNPRFDDLRIAELNRTRGA